MIKKILRTVPISFAVALFLFSCAKNTTIDQNLVVEGPKNLQTNQHIKLRWLAQWKDEGNKEFLIHEIARDYSFLHQEVDFEYLFPSEAFKHNDITEIFAITYDTIAQMARNDEWPFDIMLCDQWLYYYASVELKDPDWGKKYLVDFSQEPWFKDAHKPGILEDGAYSKLYGGIVPGPIIEGVSNVLFVSETVENLLGIKVKRNNMEVNDLLMYAQATDKYNKTHSDKITFFSMQNNDALLKMFNQLVHSEYGQLKFSSNQESFRAMATVYETLEKLSAYNPIEQYTKFPPELSYEAKQRTLKDSEILFNLQPTWIYNLWTNSNPEGAKVMKPCEIPSMDNKTSPTYPGSYQVVFVVPKHGKNVEAAKDFIRFMSTNEVAEKWIKYSKCPTGLKSQISYSDFGQEEFDKYFRHLNTKYGNNQTEIDLSMLLYEEKTTVNFYLDEVLSGSLTAQEALRNVKNQVL
jgi:ABC-type glycerol-3-phosphate transport system substrate-binding protein